MHSTILSLIVDALMAMLLLVTLYFCWRLNSRIRVLQDNRSDLAETIREFDACTRRAAESIAEIHTATQRIAENIQHKIDKANFVADDLQFLLERSGKVMDKMEPGKTGATASAARPAARAAAAPAAVKEEAAKPAAAEESKVGQRVRSRAEQELINVVKSSGKESA